jgi:hypothetical protein
MNVTKKKAQTAAEKQRAAAIEIRANEEIAWHKLREADKDEMRREVAVWLMSVRFRLNVLYGEIVDVLRESKNPSSLLHGVFGARAALNDVAYALDEVMSDLHAIEFPCNRANPVAVARDFEKSLNPNPAANASAEKEGA